MHRFVEQEVYDFADFQEEIEQLRVKEESIEKVNFYQKKFKKPIRKSKSIIKIDINAADTSEWKKLKGIGPTFANRICKFRKLLGGFHAKEQLLEVYGMDSLRYAQIEPSLLLDEALLQQLNVNTANLQALKKHPYLSFHQARAIVQFRKKHGDYQKKKSSCR